MRNLCFSAKSRIWPLIFLSLRTRYTSILWTHIFVIIYFVFSLCILQVCVLCVYNLCHPIHINSKISISFIFILRFRMVTLGLIPLFHPTTTLCLMGVSNVFWEDILFIQLSKKSTLSSCKHRRWLYFTWRSRIEFF